MDTKNEKAPPARSPRLPKGPPRERAAVDAAEIERRSAKLAAEKDAKALAPFSPSPWSYSGKRMIADGKGWALAEMVQAQPRQADMRLIAAAPELYRILRWIHDGFVWCSIYDGARTVIENALASVEGTPPKAAPAISDLPVGEAGRTGNDPDYQGEENAE